MAVDIYLLRLGADRIGFYSERPDGDGDGEADAGAGARRGWLARKSREVRDGLAHGRGRMASALRRLWGWLQRRLAPDEALLRALRKAEAIVLHHPATMPPGKVGDLWRDYLDARLRRHLAWTIFYLVLSPLTILLTPIPGPNVIGYWFAYRLITHALAVLGIRRAGHRDVGLLYQPEDVLDARLDGDGGDEVARVAAHFGLDGLGAFVAHPAGGRLVPADPAGAGREV